jgi:hypothetical protein
VPDRANEAIVTNLACRIAPSYGKQVLAGTMATARGSYGTILVRAAMPNDQQFPGTLPAGAGNKPWCWNGGPFLRDPVEPLLAGNDAPIDYD